MTDISIDVPAPMIGKQPRPLYIGSSWTDERIEFLKKLWADGLSASQIAAELGEVTRNAVIGKIHRLGLAGRVTKQVAAPRPRKPRSYVSRDAMRAERMARQDEVPTEEPEAVVIDEEIPTEQRKTFLDLKIGMCRWPVGTPGEAGFFFCAGRVASGHPYCMAHCCAAYKPPKSRRDQKTPHWRNAA